MKFGILNAWYLPDGEEGLGLYPTMTSINTFTTLFDGYFGLDYPKQPDTIYTSTSWLPAVRPDRRDRPPAEPALSQPVRRTPGDAPQRRRSRKSTRGLSSMACSASISQRAPAAARKPSSV